MFTNSAAYCGFTLRQSEVVVIVGLDARTHQRIAALMQRVLIVDPHPASAKMLAELLRNISACQLWTAPDAARGLSLARAVEPHLVFLDQSADFDAAAFSRAFRRSELASRKAPIILFCGQATAATILGARDAGVHEFLRKPFTIKDLLRRLEAVATRPRDWVEGIGYIGPDRRRFNSGDYSGPLKRRVDHAVTPDAARVEQSLRILKSAVAAIDIDPRQALRAMLTQVEELRSSGRAKADPSVRAAAMALGQRLVEVGPDGLRGGDLEPLTRPLLALLPADSAPRRPAA
jgi:two-component system, response regulator PdtaR